MNIIALLSWYDEDPDWLTRCILSLAQIPVERLIALDGAYAYYPGAQPQSDPEQAQTIRTAASSISSQVEIHRPVTVWPTEMAKRDYLFEQAELSAQPRDWYMVIDADEFVTDAPDNVHERLEHSPFDVAAITLDEPGHPLGTVRYATFPMFFRAIPGLRCADAHYRYRTPGGQLLWGDAKRDRLEPRHDLTSVRVEHHNQLRHPDRRRAALDGYQARDHAGLEDIPAHRSLIADVA